MHEVREQERAREEHPAPVKKLGFWKSIFTLGKSNLSERAGPARSRAPSRPASSAPARTGTPPAESDSARIESEPEIHPLAPRPVAAHRSRQAGEVSDFPDAVSRDSLGQDEEVSRTSRSRPSDLASPAGPETRPVIGGWLGLPLPFTPMTSGPLPPSPPPATDGPSPHFLDVLQPGRLPDPVDASPADVSDSGLDPDSYLRRRDAERDAPREWFPYGPGSPLDSISGGSSSMPHPLSPSFSRERDGGRSRPVDEESSRPPVPPWRREPGDAGSSDGFDRSGGRSGGVPRDADPIGAGRGAGAPEAFELAFTQADFLDSLSLPPGDSGSRFEERSRPPEDHRDETRDRGRYEEPEDPFDVSRTEEFESSVESESEYLPDPDPEFESVDLRESRFEEEEPEFRTGVDRADERERAPRGSVGREEVSEFREAPEDSVSGPGRPRRRRRKSRGSRKNPKARSENIRKVLEKIESGAELPPGIAAAMEREAGHRDGAGSPESREPSAAPPSDSSGDLHGTPPPVRPRESAPVPAVRSEERPPRRSLPWKPVLGLLRGIPRKVVGEDVIQAYRKPLEVRLGTFIVFAIAGSLAVALVVLGLGGGRGGGGDDAPVTMAPTGSGSGPFAGRILALGQLNLPAILPPRNHRMLRIRNIQEASQVPELRGRQPATVGPEAPEGEAATAGEASPPASDPVLEGSHYIQIQSFMDEDHKNYSEVVQYLASLGYEDNIYRFPMSRISESGKPLYWIFLGPYASSSSAKRANEDLAGRMRRNPLGKLGNLSDHFARRLGPERISTRQRVIPARDG